MVVHNQFVTNRMRRCIKPTNSFFPAGTKRDAAPSTDEKCHVMKARIKALLELAR
jgi:hypothetical protein